MQIDVKRDGSRSVLTLTGDVDLYSSPQLRDAILDLFRNRGQERVIVDLSGVGHVDSSCIASLLEGRQEAKKNNARFILVGLRESLRQLLELTRLLHTFEIRPSVEDAMS